MLWPRRKRLTKYGAAHDSHGIASHGNSSLRRRIKVPQDTAGISNGSRGEKGAKETREHKGLEVLGGGTSEAEADGHEHGCHDGYTTAIDFAQGRPQQRANAEAEKKQHRSQCRNLLGHMKVMANLHCSR